MVLTPLLLAFEKYLLNFLLNQLLFPKMERPDAHSPQFILCSLTLMLGLLDNGDDGGSGDEYDDGGQQEWYVCVLF